MTRAEFNLDLARMISTHTPLAGRDAAELINEQTGKGISTHTPLAGRDLDRRVVDAAAIISTHTPLAGRDDLALARELAAEISTHTPLAGRDRCEIRISRTSSDFNSHAPCGA